MVGRKSVKNKATEGSTSEPLLNVTAQQTRFQPNVENATFSKEITVKDLSVSLGDRELLCGAELCLQPGRHYVLIGRNGVGKSTLLRALATGNVPGIPRAIRVLLLGQVQSNEDNGQRVDRTDETVVQHVVRSDERRERLLYEARELSTAMECSSNPGAIVRAYRGLTQQRLQDQVSEAKQTAAGRSGARGLQARKALTSLEGQLTEARDQLQSMDLANGVDVLAPATVASETQKATDMLADIQSSLASTDSAAAEVKARGVLLGLGFSRDALDKPLSQLSGGWRTRCSLACALCQSADLLLLDEPTNFLDLPSIIWLEKYVQALPTTVIVVTHDRAFADEVGEELLILRNQTLEHFRGKVSGYELDRFKTYKHLNRMKEAQEKQKKHMQTTIEHNKNAAKRAGDDKKLKQAASRKKKLDERMGMEVSAKGTKFKLSRDLAGFHSNRRNDIDVPTFDPPAQMAVPTSPPDLRFPGALVSFENVTFGYTHTKPILRGINLTIHSGDRIGLVGLNGSGKSTLMALAIGAAMPMAGTIARHPRARFGLYSQQAVEELDTLAAQAPLLTALAHLRDFAGSELSEQNARALLSSLGLPGKSAADVPLLHLSGGQKVRLALAKLLCNPPHLLILDEVTTHLDSDTIQALALALRAFEGAILVVTHDRFFMRCVVEGESPKTLASGYGDRLEDDEDSSSEEDVDTPRETATYRLSKGVLRKLERGMQEYEELATKTK